MAIVVQQHDPVVAEHDVHGETAVERAAPWVSSFLMHAGLGLVGAFIVFAATRAVVSEERPTMPENFLKVDEGTKDVMGKVLPEEMLSDVTLKSMQDRFKESNHGVDPFGEALLLNKGQSGMGDRTGDTLITIGNLGGAGHGNGITIGGGPGGRAEYGPRVQMSATILPTVRAKKVVYLLDHSGSMLDSFDYLREEVKRATTALIPVQRFSVIMFSEDVTVLGPETLQRATNDAKRDVVTRLGTIRAAGQNDGLLEPFQKGFEKAFAMKPDVIVFLTDGEFDTRLVEKVRGMNRGKEGEKVEVYTIAYVQIGVEAAESLKKIAADNGGKYKFVSQKDLK